MNKYLALIYAMCFAGILMAQNTFRIMEYNVENLFDCHDRNDKDDDDFLPQGNHQWDTLRYRKKLADLSKVILAAGGATPVDVIGLCEVESDSAMIDLTQRSRIARLGYQYIITNGPDRRGINVALLYQPYKFLPWHWQAIHIPFDKEKERPIRDLLYVSGKIPNGDTLDIFVAHFPSRRGGEKYSDKLRIRTAKILRLFADSVMHSRHSPNIVIMGDMNDEPHNHSIRYALGAVPENSNIIEYNKTEGSEGSPYILLTNDLIALEGKVKGTYVFQGDWNRLDHIIVNRQMLSPLHNLNTSTTHCQILTFPFLLQTNNTNEGYITPRRTYKGTYYNGGISDHLPVMLTLQMKF